MTFDHGNDPCRHILRGIIVMTSEQLDDLGGFRIVAALLHSTPGNHMTSGRPATRGPATWGFPWGFPWGRKFRQGLNMI